MGLLWLRVTDYFEVLPGCLVKAPGLQNERPQERRGWGKGREEDQDQREEEKKGKEKPEGERGGGESRKQYQFCKKKKKPSMVQINEFIPVSDHLCQTIVLAIGKYLSIHSDLVWVLSHPCYFTISLYPLCIKYPLPGLETKVTLTYLNWQSRSLLRSKWWLHNGMVIKSYGHQCFDWFPSLCNLVCHWAWVLPGNDGNPVSLAPFLSAFISPL